MSGQIGEPERGREKERGAYERSSCAQTCQVVCEVIILTARTNLNLSVRCENKFNISFASWPLPCSSLEMAITGGRLARLFSGQRC